MDRKAALIVRGDWNVRLGGVDVIQRRSDVKMDVLRSVLEEIRLRVRLHEGYRMRDFVGLLRGRGLEFPLVILNVSGVPKGKRGKGIYLGNAGSFALPDHRKIVGVGIMGATTVARTANMKDRVVVALGSGLGTQEMAKAFISAGARAYIGTAARDNSRGASRVMFLMRCLYEVEHNGACVEDAWARARSLDEETAKFRLFFPRTQGKSNVRSVHRAVPPAAPRYVREAYGVRMDGDRADSRLSGPEIDVISVEQVPLHSLNPLRLLLEQWGYKINVHPCHSPAEVRNCIRGRGITAPLVVLESHGTEDKKGRLGIYLGKKGRDWRDPRVLTMAELGRIIRLPGRVLLATGCGLGSPEAAAAFLRGGLRAYVGAVEPENANAALMFLAQFFYDLRVNRRTIREAWSRARIVNGETALFALYPGGEKGKKPAVAKTLRWPKVIEGFDRRGANRVSSDGFTMFYEIMPSYAVPAPGGNDGFAYRLNFDFQKKQWPYLRVTLSDKREWAGARGVSFEAYVPHDLRLSRPLQCLFRVIGEKRTWEVTRINLRRGWNTVKLPFDSPLWRERIEKKRGKVALRRRPLDLKAVEPVKHLWFTLWIRGRKENGCVYFDNISIF